MGRAALLPLRHRPRKRTIQETQALEMARSLLTTLPGVLDRPLARAMTVAQARPAAGAAEGAERFR